MSFSPLRPTGRTSQSHATTARAAFTHLRRQQRSDQVARERARRRPGAPDPSILLVWTARFLGSTTDAMLNGSRSRAATDRRSLYALICAHYGYEPAIAAGTLGCRAATVNSLLKRTVDRSLDSESYRRAMIGLVNHVQALNGRRLSTHFSTPQTPCHESLA
jgi:hypothetical protein